MKKSTIFVCMSAMILLVSCASVNMTNHSEQPWIGNSFDLSRTDYRVIRPVSYEFTATYVLGIGGWKSRRENAVEKLCAMADLSKRQQVVNITHRTFVNWIVGPLVIRRETAAQGLLIEFTGENDIPQTISSANETVEEDVQKQTDLEQENINQEENLSTNKQSLIPKNQPSKQELKPEQNILVANPANKFYLAYLYKIKRLNYLDQEISKMFDLNTIKRMALDYSLKDLKRKMEGYDKDLEKFKTDSDHPSHH